MSIQDRSIALTGCVQHAWWAHRLAQHGEYREERLALAAKSIFCTDPASVMDVFGTVNDLQEGVQLSAALLGGPPLASLTDVEKAAVTGYVGQLLKLSAVLLGNPASMEKLAASLQRVNGEGEATPVSELAAIYIDNISPLSPRIMIQGNGIYLQNDEFAAGIRTHLLAAIRAAVLWRQCGGRLWHLIFQRSAYAKEFKQLTVNSH